MRSTEHLVIVSSTKLKLGKGSTPICAIRLPHTNILTFYTILIIHYHITRYIKIVSAVVSVKTPMQMATRCC